MNTRADNDRSEGQGIAPGLRAGCAPRVVRRTFTQWLTMHDRDALADYLQAVADIEHAARLAPPCLPFVLVTGI